MATTRRQLLVDLGGVAVFVGGWPLLAAARAGSEQAEQAPPPHALGDYAAAMAAISFLGPVCLEQAGFDAHADRAQVVSELSGRLQGRIDRAAPGLELPAAVDTLIRADFAAGNLVEIDGWQLSAAECSLAALAAAVQDLRSPVAPQPEEVRLGTIVEVTNWGPRSTLQGQKFNEQSDGHCGLWFKAVGAPASVAVLFDGKQQATQVYPEGLTSGISGQHMEEVLGRPGVYSVELLDRSARIRQPLGEFEVVAVPTAEELASCEVTDWGPTQATAGEPFNEQPGGASAFWVRTDCAVPGAVLEFDGRALKTTVHSRLLTAPVPRGHELQAGDYPLVVLLPGERRVPAGSLRVVR